MVKKWLRTWVEIDLDDIQKHIVIAGELTSDCGVCKEIGLDFRTVTTCPNCGTLFKYTTSRTTSTSPNDRFAILRRLKERRPDLMFIDYDDYKKLTSKSKAEEFFRGGD